jgi:hypothetical protein
MANFLSRENPDNLPDDSMQLGRRRTPPDQPSYVGSTYPARGYVVDDLKSRKSIRRMQILTAISVAVTLLLVVKYYARPTHRGAQSWTSRANPALPGPEAVPSVSLSRNAPPNQLGTSFKPENLPTASKEEVISAIQEPVREMDLARTLNRARTGDIAAQFDMGLRFADGDGVPQNHAVAMSWFARAAEGGNPEAQLKLVFGHIKGVGLPLDKNQAVTWLKRAANNGNTWAQRALSNLYFTGQCVPRDYVRAYTWAKIASESAENDNEEVRISASRMSLAQIADAERRISIWKNYSKQKPMKQPADRRDQSTP